MKRAGRPSRGNPAHLAAIVNEKSRAPFEREPGSPGGSSSEEDPKGEEEDPCQKSEDRHLANGMEEVARFDAIMHDRTSSRRPNRRQDLRNVW